MSSRRKGFSLLEILFASFLLLTAVTLTVQLINTGFRSEADSGLKIQALHDAENAVAEIEAAARSDFRADLGGLDGKSWPSASPDVVIESRVAWEPLPVPCRELEKQYDPSRVLPDLARKTLTQSAWKVTVTARNNATQLFQLTTLITDLSPETFDLRMLTPDGLATDPNGELKFRAVAYGKNNQVIEDLFLTWYVEPINSFGSIHSMRRDGWECIYKNRYKDFGNQYTTTPGLCRIVVRGEYKGQVRYAIKEITNK